jgi:teichuronic acid biosynthesis glycosyltransferase TuaC
LTDQLRVLVVTAMYPQPNAPDAGIFVAEQVDSLRRLGLDVDVLFMDTRRSRFNYLGGCRQVLLRTRRARYDLIHGHYGYAGLVARCQIGTPVVVTLHGSDVNLATQRPFSRLAAALADETIVVSAALARLAHLPSAHVIPCGVDLSAFRPMPKDEARLMLGIDPHARVVLFPSDPARSVKRFDLFQAACSRIHPSPEVLTLAGHPHARVPLYLNAADCVMLTSDTEGSPVVVREALACNTPVVSVDVGDVRQHLEGVEPGAIVPASAEALATAVEHILVSGRRSNGRERVKHLALDAIAGRVSSVYHQAVARHQASGAAARARA